MDKIFSGESLTGNPTTDVLLMDWAKDHPYLFTVIEITQPSLLILLSVFAINLLAKLLTPSSRRK